MCAFLAQHHKKQSTEDNLFSLYFTFFSFFLLTSPRRWGYQCSAKQPEIAEGSHSSGILSHYKATNTRSAQLLGVSPDNLGVQQLGRVYFCLCKGSFLYSSLCLKPRATLACFSLFLRSLLKPELPA